MTTLNKRSKDNSSAEAVQNSTEDKYMNETSGFTQPNSIPITFPDPSSALIPIIPGVPDEKQIPSSSHSIKTIGPLCLVTFAIFIPLSLAVIWLVRRKLKRDKTDILSRITSSSQPSLSIDTRESWETVVVDLPSLLDPPEPAVAGLGRLWARVTNRREPVISSTSSGWTGIEDSSLGPLEWYAKHSPPNQTAVYPRLISECEKDFLQSEERSRTWSLA
ncbi:uncharacterized protein MELLADRAFT_60798 [Melampsora larici-populina 98AG31]|uniref:Uncharacterized protein n=1 Tax=Melampsora larici-populina (strain 98AG31 / pathotype 3-4-7) TaxID=747676 RepID=F4RCD8_MELLP|nr:uncharacterized protein MELLADRAFT_60798 [Melampsora larici-populina 98AG31]EGG09711.1 hypothetical protein MELLADRAFT_60798 [Melampsora larici-populina 98AG31]